MRWIENAKLLLLFFILVALVAGLFCLKSINEKSAKFYEYENIKINLTKVKHIQPRINYVLTLSQDKDEDIHRLYSTSLNKEEIAKIENFLELAKSSEFYDIQIAAYMMFDNEKIDLFKSKRFVKLPSHYKITEYMLKVLRSYGLDEFQYNNLLKFKSQEFTTKDELVDFVIDRAKLNRNEWIVKKIISLGVGVKEGVFMKDIDNDTKELLIYDDDIEDIVDSLKSSYDNYLGIK